MHSNECDSVNRHISSLRGNIRTKLCSHMSVITLKKGSLYLTNHVIMVSLTPHLVIYMLNCSTSKLLHLYGAFTQSALQFASHSSITTHTQSPVLPPKLQPPTFTSHCLF